MTLQKELEIAMLDFKRHGDQPFDLKHIEKSQRYIEEIAELKRKIEKHGKERT